MSSDMFVPSENIVIRDMLEYLAERSGLDYEFFCSEKRWYVNLTPQYRMSVEYVRFTLGENPPLDARNAVQEWVDDLKDEKKNYGCWFNLIRSFAGSGTSLVGSSTPTFREQEVVYYDIPNISYDEWVTKYDDVWHWFLAYAYKNCYGKWPPGDLFPSNEDEEDSKNTAVDEFAWVPSADKSFFECNENVNFHVALAVVEVRQKGVATIELMTKGKLAKQVTKVLKDKGYGVQETVDRFVVYIPSSRKDK